MRTQMNVSSKLPMQVPTLVEAQKPPAVFYSTALSIQRPLPKPSIVKRLPSWPNHRPTVARKTDDEIIPKRQARGDSVGVSPKPSIKGSANRAMPKVCLVTLMRSPRVDESYITEPSEKGLLADLNGTLNWLELTDIQETMRTAHRLRARLFN